MRGGAMILFANGSTWPRAGSRTHAHREWRRCRAFQCNGTVMKTEPTKFFTVDQVADMLGVSTRSVRRWIKQKKLVAHHFGAAVRIAETDLKAFITEHRHV